jgi:hypothetical protein
MKWIRSRVVLTAALLIGGVVVVSVVASLLNGSTEEFLAGMGLLVVSASGTSFAVSTIWKVRGKIEV